MAGEAILTALCKGVSSLDWPSKALRGGPTTLSWGFFFWDPFSSSAPPHTRWLDICGHRPKAACAIG